jgi:shikimate dehydrogenase
LTIPHKQAAMTMVDENDEVARKIGAISCVVVQPDGSLAGTNNDCYGFIQNILQEQPGWRAEAGPAVVIGAGGGARAVVYGLAERGAREIRLVNRTLTHAQRIAEEFGGPIEVLPWNERHAALEDAATLVNATSQGMVGNPPLDLDLAKLKNALVADIIYIPRETPLLASARAAAAINGLGMLLHQGQPAWKSWFGIEPDVTTELRALIEATIGVSLSSSDSDPMFS